MKGQSPVHIPVFSVREQKKKKLLDYSDASNKEKALNIF